LESRENDKDASTLLVGSNQRVHNFQERVARQILHVTADSNQSNRSIVAHAELRARASRLCWGI